MSASFDKFKKEALSLELKGSEITEYIREQEKLARDERAKLREDEKAKREDEKAKRDHEAKMAELEISKLRLESGEQEVISNNTVSYEMSVKPQPYKDGEDITSYLIRFERIATLIGWDESKWAIRLGVLLQGHALKVYASLSDDVTKCYASLKKALLEAFKSNEDQYRREFRNARISHKENYSQFLNSISRMFDFWMDSLKIDRSYEDIRSAMIGDQFLASVPPEIRVFIKERRPADLSEMARLADNMASARNSYPKFKKSSNQENNSVPVSSSNENKSYVNNENKSYANNENKYRANKEPFKVTCFACGQSGHKRNNCPQKPSTVHKVARAFDGVEPRGPIAAGTINGSRVSTILRDTGCDCVIVSENLLPNVDISSQPRGTLYDYLGRADEFPIVKCYVECKFFSGWVDAYRAPIKFCSMLIGNIPGAELNMKSDVIYPDDSDDCEFGGPTPEPLNKLSKTTNDENNPAISNERVKVHEQVEERVSSRQTVARPLSKNVSNTRPTNVPESSNERVKTC